MSRALVLDTNVLVSAALKPGSDLGQIVERVLLRRVPLHVCPSIVEEYREVLGRTKFRLRGLPPAWFPRLLQVAFYEPEPATWKDAGPDPDDLVFLALAKACGAVLVSGNLNHFPHEIRRGVHVVSPASYLAEVE